MSEVAPRSFRHRVIGVFTLLGAANIGAWVWAVLAFHDKRLLLGTAFVAYSFGLRHAVDADHIAAIDNVTRKLMQAGQRPVSIGLFFSLGHSTVVVIASLIVYATASMVERQIDVAREIGSIIGTSISAFFLIAIALVNIIILRGVWKAFQEARRGRDCTNQTPDTLMGSGILGRLFRPLFRLLSSPRQMYPIGLLFGLGFDTATEVAILGISAAAAAKGLSLSTMAIFPLLFTAGMTLIDTTDGVLLVWAFACALVIPVPKHYYTLTLTFLPLT